MALLQNFSVRGNVENCVVKFYNFGQAKLSMVLLSFYKRRLVVKSFLKMSYLGGGEGVGLLK